MKHEDKNSLGFLPRSMKNDTPSPEGELRKAVDSIPAFDSEIPDQAGFIEAIRNRPMPDEMKRFFDIPPGPPLQSHKMIFLNEGKLEDQYGNPVGGLAHNLSIDTTEYNNEPNIHIVSEDIKKFTIEELRDIIDELAEEFTITNKELTFYLKPSEFNSLRMSISNVLSFTDQATDLFGNSTMASFGFEYDGFNILATFTPRNVQMLEVVEEEYTTFKYINYVTFNSDGEHKMIILPELS